MHTALLNNMSRRFIGFEPLLKFLEESEPNSNFPPHDIEKINDNKYRLTLAVAGFSKDEIELNVKSGVLLVSGSVNYEGKSEPEYLYKGIALRDFHRVFRIGENVNVVDASMVNGLLVIDLERLVPEEQQVKRIPVK